MQGRLARSRTDSGEAGGAGGLGAWLSIIAVVHKRLMSLGRLAICAATCVAATLSLLSASAAAPGFGAVTLAPAGAPAPVIIALKDWVAMPITGKVDGKGQTDGMLARVNSLREEPGGRRYFINDLNGPLYILDKSSKTFTTYLDFNGRDRRPGLFHKLAYDTGYAGGLVAVQFDPDYSHNGRFYTVHVEDPALPGSNAPDNTNAPGLNLQGYTTTRPISTPGDTLREGVLIEWTDTNTTNATFEGTAREVMRISLNTRIHPLGDLVFNPRARRGDADWRVLYIGCGDGGSGESRLSTRTNPQRLDTLVGKVLRVIPDLSEHTSTSTVGENGRYRVPNDNPYVSTRGARGEIWAYGLRNPHRLHWAIDPATRANDRLIADSVGLHTWEAVYIIHKGANYGYSQREGNETLQPDNKTTALPSLDRIPVLTGETTTDGTVAPTYPVIQYGHVAGGGDAIGSGVLYRGSLVPALRGKYIFTDLTTGHVWFADYREMLAADDGNPRTLAPIHEVKLQWTDPNGGDNAALFDTMKPITKMAYFARGGRLPDLPGRGTVSGLGRADVHVAVDGAGELYLFSKTDGMIRAVVGGAVLPETR